MGGLAPTPAEGSLFLGSMNNEPVQVTTDPNGRAAFSWTVGIAPVRNSLRDSLPDCGPPRPTLHYQTNAVREQLLEPCKFGNVNSYMNAHGYNLWASTEDLVFDNQGRMLLGVPGPDPNQTDCPDGTFESSACAGGLLTVGVDGEVSRRPLSGAADTVGRPLGIAVDQDDNIWIADTRIEPASQAVHRVGPDGTVTQILPRPEVLLAAELVTPNYLAVGPDGRIYVSDPCAYDPADPDKERRRGRLLRFMPDPVTGLPLNNEVQVHVFEPDEGPNGFAFDAGGQRLIVGTEDTVVLCQLKWWRRGHEARLVSLDITEEADFENQPLQTVANIPHGVAVDGMAFDSEGNLYVAVNTLEQLQSTNLISVLPAGEHELVPFLSSADPNGSFDLDQPLFANLAFGRGPYGESTLYIANIAINNILLWPKGWFYTRGVRRVEIGITGQPLFQ